jgi:carboxyl-terminal processing protease
MMPRLAALLLLVVAQIFVSGSSLFAAADLEPTPSQLRTTLIINRLVQAHHYRKVSLDDSLSALILNRYFLTLDPNHNYFLSEDIAHFDYLQHRLDDAIRRARLEPAFEIYKIFAQRVEERVNYAQSLLGYPFDFTIDESIDLNRNKADWAKSTDAINQVWRKRVKNDFLNEKIKGLNNKEIQQQLFKRYQRLITRIGQLNATDVFQFFINAYVTTVEPHTTYFSPRAEENFRIRMSLSLQGIGAVLQTENEYTLIRRVVAGGPAARSGKLQAGDRITGVGQGGR